MSNQEKSESEKAVAEEVEKLNQLIKDHISKIPLLEDYQVDCIKLKNYKLNEEGRLCDDGHGNMIWHDGSGPCP